MMDNAPARPHAARRAAVVDAAALTRLREVMLSDMGMPAGFTEPRYPVLQLRLAGPGARH